MKKIFFPGVLLALMFIYSCNKDEFTEEQAVQAQLDLISHQDSINEVRDSLEKVGGILQFSVSVIPVDAGVGFVSLKSAEAQKMLTGATVSVSQHGQLLTATTDESGIAVFTDLRVGTLNVSVRADGYTSANFIVVVEPDGYDIGDAWNLTGLLRHAATMVPVFNLTEGTSNISGVVTYETDLTNEVPEAASDVNVIARIDIDDSDFVDNYFYNVLNDTLNDYVANIEQIAYNELIASSITDADGMYSIDMPSAADGLPIMLEVDEVVADQDLLLSTLYDVDVQGVQTVRTLFSSSVSSPSPVTAGVPAYVEFGAPTGVVTQQPLVIAEATAVIGESGIAAIIIKDQGSGYTQPPKIVITGDGEGAEAVAYISEGKVTSIEITKAGKGYTTATVTADSFVETVAEATPVVEYGITQIDVDDAGSGYKSTPDVVITSSSGSGASADAIMSGYISNIDVTNMGSGYVCPPLVQIARGTGTLATAVPTMTTYNPLYGIELMPAYTDGAWFETVPSVEITTTAIGLTGSGATAVVDLSTAGRIKTIVLSNPGADYAEPPTVLITGGGGTGAVAEAILDPADGSISIDILEQGSGYTSDPTIQISAPAAGGIAAVVDHVVREFQVTGITLTNPGSGYNIAYNALAGDLYDDEPTVIIDGGALGDADVTVRPDMKVESIAVTAGGTEYDFVNPPAITITPKCGYGSGATAVAEVLLEVASIDITNAGSGYYETGDIEIVIVTPPEGCDEQALASVPGTGLGAGVLTSVTVDEEGMGYIASPKAVLLDGAGDTVAYLMASVSNGVVTLVSFDAVENLEVDTYTIAFSTFDVAADFDNKGYAQSGKISFVQIDVPGAGYASAPLVRFVRVDDAGDPVETGGFIDAEATAVIADGRVVGIDITNPGTGYYYAPIIEIYVPDFLRVAKGTVTVNADGYIEKVNITEAGMGYSTAPSVTFTASVPGMGSGAAGTAVIENGVVDHVVMTDNGSGYLGKNTPSAAAPVSIKPVGSLGTFNVYAGKSYIKDIYLGTGVRNDDAN